MHEDTTYVHIVLQRSHSISTAIQLLLWEGSHTSWTRGWMGKIRRSEVEIPKIHINAWRARWSICNLSVQEAGSEILWWASKTSEAGGLWVWVRDPASVYKITVIEEDTSLTSVSTHIYTHGYTNLSKHVCPYICEHTHIARYKTLLCLLWLLKWGWEGQLDGYNLHHFIDAYLASTIDKEAVTESLALHSSSSDIKRNNLLTKYIRFQINA